MIIIVGYYFTTIIMYLIILIHLNLISEVHLCLGQVEFHKGSARDAGRLQNLPLGDHGGDE